jgi:hypothetical protein
MDWTCMMSKAQNFDTESSVKATICRLDGNIKLDLREISFEDVYWTEMAKNLVKQK